MRTIHKYQLEVTDEQYVEMPLGGQILSVALQRECLCLWALVETKHPKERRKILILGTGNPVPSNIDGCIFLGTAVIEPFVWHVFEEEIRL